MTVTMRISPSPFDTEILAVRVGKVVVQELSPKLLDELRQELAAADLDLLFIRDTRFPFERTAAFDWTGLDLADVKVVLTNSELAAVVAESKKGFGIVSDLGPDQAIRLRPLTRSIALRSRFARWFGEERACRLYDVWLENSLSHEAADWCLVCRETASGDPAGLIAVRRSGDTAEMTLVATAEQYRGQGILRFLSSHVLAFLHSQRLRACTVSTQLSNPAAFRAYQSLGFAFDGTIVDLHLHRR